MSISDSEMEAVKSAFIHRAQQDRKARAHAEQFSFRVLDAEGPAQIECRNVQKATEYRIKLLPGRPECSCDDYKGRCQGTAIRCKHLHALEAFQKALRAPDEARERALADRSRLWG